MKMHPIATRIHELRGHTSQAELAARAGVSRAALSQVESGRHEPGIRFTQAIAAALGVTVGVLLGESESSSLDAYMLHERTVDHELRARVDAAIDALDHATAALRDLRDAL